MLEQLFSNDLSNFISNFMEQLIDEKVSITRNNNCYCGEGNTRIVIIQKTSNHILYDLIMYAKKKPVIQIVLSDQQLFQYREVYMYKSDRTILNDRLVTFIVSLPLFPKDILFNEMDTIDQLCYCLIHYKYANMIVDQPLSDTKKKIFIKDVLLKRFGSIHMRFIDSLNQYQIESLYHNVQTISLRELAHYNK